MTSHKEKSRKPYNLMWLTMLILISPVISAQQESEVAWIRPDSAHDLPVWGIKNGVVLGLWPNPIENEKGEGTGGPRGLLRLGHEFNGKIHQLTFIAVEPVVNNEIEFSEISPSHVDGKWGKLMWAGNDEDDNYYEPFARTRGIISHPDPQNPEIEELSFFVFMEKFFNGAHPYFKVSIRSDRPEEVGFELFNHQDSATMDRFVLTATMGNYARLRKLHLKDEVIYAKELYSEYDGIDFVEKEPYFASRLPRTANGGVIAVMETDESFSELASWPQTDAYMARSSWRYKPFYKLVQYWRKDAGDLDPSLRVRVNGRVHYWAVASRNKDDYVDIPGGVSFENFEFREDYRPGQKIYFGLSRKSVEELLEMEN